jgi:hypothetical protein
VVEATDNAHARGARTSQDHRNLTGLDGTAHRRSQPPVHPRRRTRGVAERFATIDTHDRHTYAPRNERLGSARGQQTVRTVARSMTIVTGHVRDLDQTDVHHRSPGSMIRASSVHLLSEDIGGPALPPVESIDDQTLSGGVPLMPARGPLIQALTLYPSAGPAAAHLGTSVCVGSSGHALDHIHAAQALAAILRISGVLGASIPVERCLHRLELE